MRSLFPVSVATRLVQLKHLHIYACGLEEIIAKEEVDGNLRFLFPQLTFLQLDYLPELKHFYLGLHTVELPVLKQLAVYNCRKIKIYASELYSFQKTDGESQPAPFLFEKVLPNLELLGLDAHDFRLMMNHMPAESFGNLKELALGNFDDESVAFLFDFLQRLYHLERLFPCGNSFKELFPYKKRDIWKQGPQVDQFLPNLQTLEVRTCHHLTYLMPSLASFKNLTTLDVFNCNGLENILPCSTARTLVQLRTMRIRECKLLTEVIVNEVDRTEEEIVFWRLETLELQRLSSLTCFCSANYNFKFPCLEKVLVSQCPKLLFFSQGRLSTPMLKRVQTEQEDPEYFWKDDLNFTVKQMFTDMVGFRNLEHLELSDCPALKEKIWNSQVQASLFCNLKSLVLDGFSNMSIVFPSNVLCYFRNLESLELRSCDSLKQAFDLEGINADGHTLKKNCEEFLGFKSLKSVKVQNCSSLRYIFTPFIILGLVKLEKIEIENCALIEEIINKEGEKDAGFDKTVIPQLNSVVLKLLPCLKSFYSGINALECPSLETITMSHCPKMETFVFTDLKENSDHIAPFFSEKVGFPKLEKMILLHLENLQLIWHNQLHANSFCKLKEVRVEFCQKLTTFISPKTCGLLTFHHLEILNIKNCQSMRSLFPVSVATRLVQLKHLHIYACGLEEIIAKEEVDGNLRFLFPQLTFLQLDDLPELKHFYLGLHTVEMPMLKRLAIYECRKIKIYASESYSFQKTNGESQPALFFFEKVIPDLELLGLDAHDFRLMMNHIPAESFGNLKELALGNFDDESVAFLFDFLQRLYHLERLFPCGNSFKELFPYKKGDIWKFGSHVDQFLPNLRTLEVERCHHLTHLMPSLASFKNLTTLDVFNCNGLVHILSCSTARTLVQLRTMGIRECKLVTEVLANEVDRTQEEVILCRLETLELQCLSSLTCFCSANYNFKFPCLEQVIVSQCPKLKIFSPGVLSTPMLTRVQLTKQEDQEYFWKDDLNSTMQQLFTNMVGFRQLEHLKLSEFPTLKEKLWGNQVSVSLFDNLKSLVVDEYSDMSTALPSNVFCCFKSLEKLDVITCDSVEQVFDLEGLKTDGRALNKSHQEILGFNNLKSLKVHNCGSLRCIFTPSIILGLGQLQEIEIKNCALIEQIIMKEEEVTIDKIIIPQLNSVILESLPSLTSFYSGGHSLECPPLKTVIIKDCPKISTKDLSIHLASLFTKNVVIPTLEDLTLSPISTERIWPNQQPAASSCFHNLTILVIDGFNHLKYLFLSSIVRSLFQLKELEISNCRFIGVIVEDDEIVIKMFPKLYQLKLRDLPSLTRFCNSTGNFVELSSLYRLWIENCPRMKTFVSSSTCADMTSSKECEELNLNENLLSQMQSLFDKKIRLPRLERLQITHMDELCKIWDDQFSLDSFCKLNRLRVGFCNKLVNIIPSNMLGRHQKLEMLWVENCDSVEEIFEVLEERSWIVDETVSRVVEVPQFVFSELTSLHLKMLPSLKGLYSGTHTSKWPVLKELKVCGCDRLEIFASEFPSLPSAHWECQQEITIQRPLFLIDKDGFPSLEELELCELPGLLHIWRENSRPSNALQNLRTLKVSKCGNLENLWPSMLSLRNLMTLEVSKCDGLRYLLTFTKAKTLVQLRSMNISDCKMMEKILQHLGEVKDSVVFNKLDNLELRCLPSLRSFCSGDYALEFPSLEKLVVRQCLMMETFSLGFLSTPKLQRLQYLREAEDEVEECWGGDLNSTIRHLFKTMTAKED